MENFYFENRCTVREEMVLDFLRLKTKKLVPLRILVAVMAAVCMLLQLFVWLMSKAVFVEDVLRMCLCAAAVALIWFTPRICARLSMRKAEKLHGGTLPESVTRFGEQIETNTHEGAQIIEYAQIVAVYRLPDSYALRLPKNRVLFLACDGFVRGDFAGFRQFLRMKRPDLVIPE